MITIPQTSLIGGYETMSQYRLIMSLWKGLLKCTITLRIMVSYSIQQKFFRITTCAQQVVYREPYFHTGTSLFLGYALDLCSGGWYGIIHTSSQVFLYDLCYTCWCYMSCCTPQRSYQIHMCPYSLGLVQQGKVSYHSLAILSSALGL